MNSKELAELIHQNTRIILPEFGAFLVKDSGDKGFNPANVSFSPFLRYNDGMIEIYVAKSRGISKEEAAKDVQHFVETIKNELLEKGTFELEGLGYLKRDQRGSLSFSLSQSKEKKDLSDTPTADSSISKKNVTVEVAPTKEKNDEKIDVWLVEDKPLDSDDPNAKKIRKISGSKATVEKLTTTKKGNKPSKKVDELQQEPVKDNQPLTDVEIIPESSIEKVQTTKSIVDKVIESPKEIESNEQVIQIETKDSPIIELDKPDYSNSVTYKPKKSKGLLYTAIAIGVIAILFFLVRSYYFPPNIESTDDSISITSKPESIINEKVEAKDKINKPKDDIDKAFNEQSNDKKRTKEEIKKEKEQEDAIASSLIENAKFKNPESKIISGVKYYIIAGSFKNPDYANKFLQELKSKGYNASIVIQPSGMNAVNIGNYSNHDEANKALKEFKSKLPNLWILKK